MVGNRRGGSVDGAFAIMREAGRPERGRLAPLGLRCPPFSLGLGAALLYLPANLLPIMVTSQFGRTTENTIIGGVVRLIEASGAADAMLVVDGIVYSGADAIGRDRVWMTSWDLKTGVRRCLR